MHIHKLIIADHVSCVYGGGGGGGRAGRATDPPLFGHVCTLNKEKTSLCMQCVSHSTK